MVDSASIIKIEEFDTVLMTLAFEFFFKTNGQIDRFIERFSLFFIFAKVRNYSFQLVILMVIFRHDFYCYLYKSGNKRI